MCIATQWRVFSLKKERITIDSCNNMDGSQKHEAERKKPDTKEYMLYNPIYINS